MSIRDELKFIAENEPNLTEKQRQIGGQIMKEIRNRLQFLQSVGLDYLTLARSAGTLSGGESQRDPPDHSNRQCAFRRALCAGRAVYRLASAR